MNTLGGQKFHKGDRVKIAKFLGDHMSHFQSDCEAIVIGSYADQYGGENSKSYTLHLQGSGQCSWYEQHQLTLIEHGRLDLLALWEKEIEDRIKTHSDLEWIFSNGSTVVSEMNAISATALGSLLGITNMWGPHGEGIVYMQNVYRVLRFAEPYLLTGDRNGFMAKISELRKGS